MYTKDKNHRITLRLNEDQFLFVKESADALEVSPSDFLRMVVNASLAASKKYADTVMKGAGDGRANDKTDINDSV